MDNQTVNMWGQGTVSDAQEPHMEQSWLFSF